jgi:hypothetical protein
MLTLRETTPIGCCADTDADLTATAAELAQGSFCDLAWVEERALDEGPAAFAPLMGMALNLLGHDPRMAPGIQLAPSTVLRIGVALLVPRLLVVALWFTQGGAGVRTSGLDWRQIVVGREIQRWASWTNRSCCNATGSTWSATTAWAKPG